jgi:predicted ATP-grasp superfamily ATP-dependent carboligase/phosphoglycolate phosphatase-like HAD superfamily hydrolase
MLPLLGHPDQTSRSTTTSKRDGATLAGAQRGKTTALIVSANQRKAYPIIKSLKQMKYTTIGAFYLWRSPVFSRYLDHRYHIANPYEHEKAFLTQIGQLMDQYNPVVIPVGFIDALLLTRYRKSVSKKGVILGSDHADIKNAANKTTLNRLSQATGVLYPATEQITKRSWKVVLKNLGLPLVVKGKSDAAHPQYAFHASELEQIVISRNEPLIAQQFIPGTGTGYFTIALNGYILAEYVHRRVIETQPSGGPSLVACHDADSPVYDLGRKITRNLSWSGPLMIEFRKHEESGDYYLIELNPKFWGSLELATAWGLDFPQYLLHSQEYGWALSHTDHEFPLFHQRGSWGCFSWLLPGFSAYFRVNPKVWLRMLWNAWKHNHRTDIHLQDPPELLYGLISRLFNILRPKAGHPKKALLNQYRKNIQMLQQRLYQEPIKAIIFDLDGTLVDLKVNWGKVRQMLLLQGLLAPAEASVMIGLYQAQQKDPDLFAKMSHIVETYEEHATAKLSRSKAVIKSLKTLHQYNIKIAIVSKQTTRNIRNAIKCLGIEGTVDFIVGREHGMQRVHQTQLACQSLQIKTPCACFIGDTIGDAVSAATLQMKPIAITNNSYRFQQFTELGVPCFHKVADFLRIIEKRYKKG